MQGQGLIGNGSNGGGALTPQDAARAVSAVVGELQSLRKVMLGLTKVLERSAPSVGSVEGDILGAMRDATVSMRDAIGGSGPGRSRAAVKSFVADGDTGD